MKKHPDMITKFLTHMGSAAIMDLLLKLISMDDSESGILQVRTRADLMLETASLTSNMPLTNRAYSSGSKKAI